MTFEAIVHDGLTDVDDLGDGFLEMLVFTLMNVETWLFTACGHEVLCADLTGPEMRCALHFLIVYS